MVFQHASLLFIHILLVFILACCVSVLSVVISVYRLCTNTLSCLSSDLAGVSVCPPVAMDMGLGLLCRLLELWGQVPAGLLALTEWLLGDEDGSDEVVADKASSLVSICHVTC